MMNWILEKKIPQLLLNGEPEKKKNRNRKRKRSSELIATEGKENHPMLDPCNCKFKNCALIK